MKNPVNDARFPIGCTFIKRGKKREDRCTVIDILRTYNDQGALVRLRYAATHDFMGQTVTDYDVTDTAIARGLLVQLACQMDSSCTKEVTHIDESGFVYCLEHGNQRKRVRRCRLLKPKELKTLKAGGQVEKY